MTGALSVLDRSNFSQLFGALTRAGYTVLGPTVRDQAIVYAEIRDVADLPEGWGDAQEAGTYRLKRRDDRALFGFNNGPHSWKQFLFVPELRLWRARKDGKSFEVEKAAEDAPRYAILGARSCDLHAIATQDKVFLAVDPVYRARREKLFVVAVNCATASGTCFCVSMKTGPRATIGFDVAITEIGDRFVVEIATDRGREVMRDVPMRPATPEDTADMERTVERTASQMGRTMESSDLKDLLYRNYEHPRWSEVAQRCMTCANCTMVCPTCFCSNVEEVTELSGDHTERWRKWDSCFTISFSYMHGGSQRPSTRSRYRQWMTHKLATWHDQFGTSGCVGCGRCITWCPVGIDITEEVAAIRKSEATHGTASH